jgi:hypothetical protein
VSDASPTRADDPRDEELATLLGRARGGDESALPALREYLDDRPELWRRHGDLAAHARRAWIGLIAGRDLALGESVARKVEELGNELAGPRPSPMERLLVERIQAAWLQLQHAELAAAQTGTSTLAVAAFHSRRLDRAHRRFLTALGALATLRRLEPDAGEAGGLDDLGGGAGTPEGVSILPPGGLTRPRLRIAGSPVDRIRAGPRSGPASLVD